MEYRNIFIANPAKLSVQRNQLVIQQEQQFTVPLEDMYGAAVCVCPHLQWQGFRRPFPPMVPSVCWLSQSANTAPSSC